MPAPAVGGNSDSPCAPAAQSTAWNAPGNCKTGSSAASLRTMKSTAGWSAHLRGIGPLQPGGGQVRLPKQGRPGYRSGQKVALLMREREHGAGLAMERGIAGELRVAQHSAAPHLDASVIGDSTNPGQMVLTKIPSR